jgi:hypothetical protein
MAERVLIAGWVVIRRMPAEEDEYTTAKDRDTAGRPAQQDADASPVEKA